jgi:hypothetical protein
MQQVLVQVQLASHLSHRTVTVDHPVRGLNPILR